MAKSLIAVRAGIILTSVAATLLLPLCIGVDGFGEFACCWAMLLIGSRLVACGTSKFLLKELPSRVALGVFDLPRKKTILHVVVYPVFLSVIYGTVVWLAVGLTGLFGYVKTIPLFPFWLGAGSYMLHLLGVAAVGVRIKWGTWAVMCVRDATQHLATLLLIAVAAVSGIAIPSGVFLIVVVCVIAVTVSVLLFALILNGTFLLKKDSAELKFNTGAFWANDLSGCIINSFDIIISGMLFPAALAGLYALIKKLTNLTSFGQSVANDWASVRVAKAYSHQDTEKIKSICQTTLKFTMPLSAFSATLVYFAATYWLFFIDSENFAAVQILLFLLLTGNFIGVFFGQNFTLASQSGLETQAFFSRWLGVVTFGVLMLIGRLFVSEVWLIGFAQCVAILMANLMIWKIVQRTRGVDSSAFSLIR